jgi:hypothetical protein
MSTSSTARLLLSVHLRSDVLTRTRTHTQTSRIWVILRSLANAMRNTLGGFHNVAVEMATWGQVTPHRALPCLCAGATHLPSGQGRGEWARWRREDERTHRRARVRLQTCCTRCSLKHSRTTARGLSSTLDLTANRARVKSTINFCLTRSLSR